jgi:hypothetical protein
MNKMLKIKLGLPILAAFIAIIASAFTVPANHAKFTGTSFYAQETGAITYAVGFTFATLPSGVIDVSTAVTSSTLPVYANDHCTNGFNRTCVVETQPVVGGPNNGKPKIVTLEVGEWHS